MLLGQITVVPDLLKPFVIALAVAGLHLLFSSNTVTASIIVPILVALAHRPEAERVGRRGAGGVHLVAWRSSSSEGPTTIIPYSSGYFSIKDMAKAGLLMTVLAALSAHLVETARLAGW